MRYWYLGVLIMILAVLLEMAEDRRSMMRSLVLKTIASALFVLTGYFSGRAGTAGSFFKWVLIGLFFGFLGDVVLHVKHFFNESRLLFGIGALLFLTGHCFYIAALVPGASGLIDADLILTAFLSFVLITGLFGKLRPTDRLLKTGAAVYIVIVTFMASLAVSSCILRFSAGTLLFAAGSVLFLISDTTLIHGALLPEETRRGRWILMLTYYAAQSLIALSLQYA